MTPEQFVSTYLPFAKESENKTGISHLFTLAQGALESGWGKKVVGNNFFGIKSFSDKDKRQLITTTEILSTPDRKFPEVISVTKLPSGKYKYKVKDWFKAYDSPADCFHDHDSFFFKNPRYKEALKDKADPYKFAEGVAKAGYATATNYADTLKSMIDSVKKRLPK